MFWVHPVTAFNLASTSAVKADGVPCMVACTLSTIALRGIGLGADETLHTDASLNEFRRIHIDVERGTGSVAMNSVDGGMCFGCERRPAHSPFKKHSDTVA